MALTITKLKMWKDPGYTRGCLEVPPAGSKKLPAPDYTLAADETLRPHKGSTLTELHLPLSFTATFGMSYLYIEATDGAGSVSLFGWIDSITQRSTSAEGITILWSVDWWRSYSSNAVFGAGQIIRCSSSTYKRPYPTRPRYKVIDKAFNLADATPYFIICQSITDANDKITSFAYWFAPIGQQESGFRTLTLMDIYSGKLDELMGIDPESIISAWISPFELERFFTDKTWKEGKTGVGYYAWYSKSPSMSSYLQKNAGSVFTTGLLTDDTEEIALIGPFGDIMSVLPWGIALSSTLIIVPNLSPDSLSFYIFDDRLANEGKGNELVSTGAFFRLDCLNVPVNSNAFSSYYYSGAREYDKQVAEIQRNQQAVNGIASAATSAASGAIGGAIAGAAGGPVGAIGGAALGAVGPMISVGVDYFASGFFNDQLQEEKDKLYSNQTSTLIKGGNGMAWLIFADNENDRSECYKIVSFKFDNTSLAEYNAQISQNGYAVDIPTNNATSYITAGGPLQIQKLTVTGNIPPQAKQAIKDKLSSGVRIIENNPTGVVP